MTQREHAGLGDSQTARIFAALEAARGAWVPMPDLVRISGSYAVHSRVSELRAWGYDIRHRNERDGRRVRSFYRLEYQA